MEWSFSPRASPRLRWPAGARSPRRHPFDGSRPGSGQVRPPGVAGLWAAPPPRRSLRLAAAEMRPFVLGKRPRDPLIEMRRKPFPFPARIPPATNSVRKPERTPPEGGIATDSRREGLGTACLDRDPTNGKIIRFDWRSTVPPEVGSHPDFPDPAPIARDGRG